MSLFPEENILTKEIEEEYAEVIRKYSFPLKGLLKIIYPEFIQQATREASIKSK